MDRLRHAGGRLAGGSISFGREARHCAPSTPAGHPAIILLHGAGGYEFTMSVFENLCSDLAEHGYYVESIEYFSQTGGEVGPITGDDVKNCPIFVREVESGIDELGKNPAVDPKRIGLMGYSLGAYLSLAIGGSLAVFVELVAELLKRYQGSSGGG